MESLLKHSRWAYVYLFISVAFLTAAIWLCGVSASSTFVQRGGFSFSLWSVFPLQLGALWNSFAFFIVSQAYFKAFGFDEFSLGKSKLSGAIDTKRKVALLPFFLAIGVFWWLVKVIKREHPYHLVHENLYVGRRPLSVQDIPEDATYLLDMTAEFEVPACIRTARLNYICCPALDTMAPTEANFIETLKELFPCRDGVIFVHCAFGHSRSVMAAAAIMMLRCPRQFPSIDAAEALIASIRKGIHIRSEQRVALLQACRRLVHGLDAQQLFSASDLEALQTNFR